MIFAVILLAVTCTILGVTCINLCERIKFMNTQNSITYRQLNTLAKKFVRFKQSYVADLESDIKELRVVGDMLTRIEMLEKREYGDMIHGGGQ